VLGEEQDGPRYHGGALAMDSRTRLLTALDHREPDHVPLDLGGSRATGIHVAAYGELRATLGLPQLQPRIVDFSQRLADVDEDVMEFLGSDVKCVNPASPSSYHRELLDDGQYLSYLDEWQIGRRMPKLGGLYYDPFSAPLPGEITEADVDAYQWPDPSDPARYVGLAERARRIALVEHRGVYVSSICSGVTEVFLKLRGFEDGYMDLAANPRLARRMMERILEIKIAFWDKVLGTFGDIVDVAGESDDLGGQLGPLFSPKTYRELVKPLHAELFRFIHAHSRAKVFLHSCGAVREFIPDLIDAGLDVLNPIQVSAPGMDTAELKREFGRDLSFWGGGVDTQRILDRGSRAEIREDVRHHVMDLRPQGGFVFATVHNIQANVPAGNIVAMWEAWRDYGHYTGANIDVAAAPTPAD
jgi:uroporphyrinogen decarboxylase